MLLPTLSCWLPQAKCTGTSDCVAFELYLEAGARSQLSACYIFRGAMEPPFVANDNCLTCVRKKEP